MRSALVSFFLCASLLVVAQEAPPPPAPASSPEARSDRESWPEAIEDNSFLIEEAYNQDPGVVQWIFEGMRFRPDGAWAASFTNEWPVPGITHQLSYTLNWAGTESGGPSGIADVLINYRYQLCQEERDGVAIAPRLSAVLPTGDWRRGLGLGALGVQVELPLSKRISPSFALHFNLGGSYLPAARGLDPVGDVVLHDLWGANEGMSIIWLASPRFNLMLEAVAYQQDQFFSDGSKVRTHQALVNPGFRYAFNFSKGQLVVGASVPIGLTADSPNGGVLLYLSWEAPVWKPRPHPGPWT